MWGKSCWTTRPYSQATFPINYQKFKLLCKLNLQCLGPQTWFGDSYRRVGHSVCIHDSPGWSGRVGIDASLVKFSAIDMLFPFLPIIYVFFGLTPCHMTQATNGLFIQSYLRFSYRRSNARLKSLSYFFFVTIHCCAIDMFISCLYRRLHSIGDLARLAFPGPQSNCRNRSTIVQLNSFHCKFIATW